MSPNGDFSLKIRRKGGEGEDCVRSDDPSSHDMEARAVEIAVNALLVSLIEATQALASQTPVR